MKVERARELVAEMYDVGVKRVKILDPSKVAEAMTREDLRGLVEAGVILIEPKKGQSRARARYIHRQKVKGKRRGPGSRKGKKTARAGKKEIWMARIRAIRKLLRILRRKGKIDRRRYRRLYLLAKGGFIRTRRHVLEMLGEL